MTVASPATPSSRLRSIRWRTVADRVLVLALILAAWQIGSAIVGLYWLSSPWATVSRFAVLTLNGELVRHASYTLWEAAAGTFIGGLPAVLLPFLLRRHPIIVAILDPFMAGGYGAPKLAFAPLFILWFGIGIESKIALVASVVFFIVYFATLAGVRAPDGADRGRERAAGGAPHRHARRGAGDICRIPDRGALCDRRRRDRN
jgi:NitT/TauT family transport system permease protein